MAGKLVTASIGDIPVIPTVATWGKEFISGIYIGRNETHMLLARQDDSRRHTVKIADLASSASGLAQIWFHEGQSQANFNKCVKSCRLSTALKTGIIEARAAKTPLNVDALLFQALMPFGFPAPPLISRPGETFNANLYVVAVNHWYMAMTLKGMTADDLQLVPAFVAFAEDSWGIPITNRLGINSHIVDGNPNDKPRCPTFSSKVAKQIIMRMKAVKPNMDTTPGPCQVLLVLHLADDQKASGQQLASWNYAQDMAAQIAKTTAGRTEGAGGETSMPQASLALPAAPPTPEVIAPMAAALAAPLNVPMAAAEADQSNVAMAAGNMASSTQVLFFERAADAEVMAPIAAALVAPPNVHMAAAEVAPPNMPNVTCSIPPSAQAALSQAFANASPLASTPFKFSQPKGSTSALPTSAAAGSTPSQRPKRKAAAEAQQKDTWKDAPQDEGQESPKASRAHKTPRTSTQLAAVLHPQDVPGHLRGLLDDPAFKSMYRNDAELLYVSVQHTVNAALKHRAEHGAIQQDAAAEAAAASGSSRAFGAGSSGGGISSVVVVNVFEQLLDGYAGHMEASDWEELMGAVEKMAGAAKAVKDIKEKQQNKQNETTKKQNELP